MQFELIVKFCCHTMIANDSNAIIRKEDNPMAKGTITIQTQPELEEKITGLAKAMDRSRNWVIEDALKRYIETEEWQIEGIRKVAGGKGKVFHLPLHALFLSFTDFNHAEWAA